MTAVRLSDVAVLLSGREIVEDVTLALPPGHWLGLIGPNGAGKTTLLRAIAGLLPHRGRIELDGADVARSSRRRMARLVAYVPQRPVVPGTMSVADYVLTGRTPYISYLGTEDRRDLEVAGRVLETLELGPFADRTLDELSGGELQRVVLARAIAQETPLLLLDEPTTGLDVGHRQQALELLDRLRSAEGLTVITAMHDLTFSGLFADRLVLMDGGRAVASGTAREVLTESRIRRHYGASVRVVEEEGGVVVIPRRPAIRTIEEGTA